MSSSTQRSSRGRSAGLFGSALLALVVAVTACTASAPPTPAPAALGVLGVLKIGILVPFTESAIDSDIGASQRRAADLYLKLKGGLLAGREVQLVYNDESSLEASINTARIAQFLKDDHVELLLGGAADPAAYQLRDTAEASKMIYIDTNATANALTRGRKSKYVFRAAPSSWQLSEPLGEYESKLGLRDFFVVAGDDAFGTDSATAFAEGLAKNGGKVTGRSIVPAKTGADWAKVVAAIKAQPVKNVFVALITDDAEGFMNAWGSAGMAAGGYKLAGPGHLSDFQVLKTTKQAALGAVTAYPWSSELDNAENKTFTDEFKKAYKDDETGQPLPPDGYAVEMWNTMRALEEALKVTKGATADTDALIAALEGVSFNGPGGAFAFDRATHSATQDLYARVVKAVGGVLVNAVADKLGSVKDQGQ